MALEEAEAGVHLSSAEGGGGGEVARRRVRHGRMQRAHVARGGGGRVVGVSWRVAAARGATATRRARRRSGRGGGGSRWSSSVSWPCHPWRGDGVYEDLDAGEGTSWQAYMHVDMGVVAAMGLRGSWGCMHGPGKIGLYFLGQNGPYLLAGN